jgi:hypothetical protein
MCPLYRRSLRQCRNGASARATKPAKPAKSRRHQLAKICRLESGLEHGYRDQQMEKNCEGHAKAMPVSEPYANSTSTV